MQLAELLKDWPCTVKGSIREEVFRLEDVVDEVRSGDLFIARKGKKHDSKKWIKKAIESGAKAIVVDDEVFFDGCVSDIPFVWVPNILQFSAYASAKLCGFPSEALTIIAITGTNGKTTVSHLIGQLLQKMNKRVLVIGTNGVYLNGTLFNTNIEQLTTLQPKHLHPILLEAVRKNVQYVVMEASSMGLATHRLDECDIDVGVFLNLGEDHLEDHGSFEQYKLAKQRLAGLSKKIVLNGDDSFCRGVGVLAKREKRYFGIKGRVDVLLQLLAEGKAESTCCVQMANHEKVITIPFIGDYQRSNIAAAITVMDMLNFPFEDVMKEVPTLTLPIGRMQTFNSSQGFQVIVDYAHTADALKAVLQAVKNTVEQKLFVVFSCGGERDVAKRKEMGTVASKYADHIILTTDNCRSEDPEVINEQIATGFFATQSYEVILSRAEAIETALRQATEGDVIVIAGKGHERTQTIGDVTTPFSDIDYVMNLLARLDDEK
ncbi:UDP-N-acetylmuramoyl-L-alanyl-D-glutamate--2,6-diaminopimelate ligase [Lysinibacillus sp. LZ02]|uniref:UDP-N-acetylmuramoyl-L-alanyl-D-glutamate--2, 6-diaminopimelate ligase n=1 Tax=Lysinibacillus sp. LZ02 TaxID=3420668 RepID=UPI003D3618D3